eukprot:3125664-Rhodomonas_salina.2
MLSACLQLRTPSAEAQKPSCLRQPGSTRANSEGLPKEMEMTERSRRRRGASQKDGRRAEPKYSLRAPQASQSFAALPVLAGVAVCVVEVSSRLRPRCPLLLVSVFVFWSWFVRCACRAVRQQARPTFNNAGIVALLTSGVMQDVRIGAAYNELE